MSADPATTDGLQPQLSFRDAVALVIGAVIGSAIFLVPSTVLAAQPSALAAILTFVLGGFLSWLGALAYAELGSMFPHTGGEYVYLRESWGEFPAFLCGWGQFLVIQTAGIAALAVGFSSLLGTVVPLQPWAIRLAAPGLILLLTIVNYRGVRPGAWTGGALTLLKTAGLLLMLAAVLRQGEPVPIDWSWPNGWSMSALALAIVPVLWAYEGWNLVTFVSGEIRNARRSVPLALGSGLLFVIVVYAVSMWVYLRTMPISDIVSSTAVAPEAAMRVLGPGSGTFVTMTMIFAVVGASNAAILAAPRLYFAQARDKLFFPWFAYLHPRHRTPSRGLLLQGLWSSILSLTGSYETLLTCCVFVAWLNYALCSAGVIWLRWKAPERPRAYRMWGAPWTAAAFSLTACAVVAGSFITRPVASGAGLALMLSGVPLYRRWRRQTINSCNM